MTRPVLVLSPPHIKLSNNTTRVKITRYPMKSVLVVLMLIWGGCAQAVRLQQSPAPDEVAVARFFVNVEGMETEFSGEATGLVPAIVQVARAAEAAKESIEAMKNPDTSPMKAVMDSVYLVIADGLTEELNLFLLPIDTLRGKVPYYFGYPMGTAEKALKKGPFAQTLEIEADVSFPDPKPSHWSIFGTGKAKVKGRPEIELRVRMVEASGEVTWRDKVRVRSREQVQIDEQWVLGIPKHARVTSSATLPEMIREAVDALVRKHSA